MYQNGLVRVSPQADATGNIVGIAVTEAVVIPSPEEILSRDVPPHFGPCTDVNNSLRIRGECS